MKKSLLASVRGLLRPNLMTRDLAAPAIIRQRGEFIGRARTADVAFQFRMGAGSVGTVNRTHPASIEPALNDTTNPLTLFGQACLTNATANSVRAILTSDSGISAIYGVSVRPYPFQASTGGAYGAQGFGGEVPAPGAVDVLRSGYILVQLQNYAVNTSAKGGTVYVWVAASTGQHVLGGFEAAQTGASTIALDAKSSFNGPPDANGVCELAFNI